VHACAAQIEHELTHGLHDDSCTCLARLEGEITRCLDALEQLLESTLATGA
jgi:hypothetical protein